MNSGTLRGMPYAQGRVQTRNRWTESAYDYGSYTRAGRRPLIYVPMGGGVVAPYGMRYDVLYAPTATADVPITLTPPLGPIRVLSSGTHGLENIGYGEITRGRQLPPDGRIEALHIKIWGTATSAGNAEMAMYNYDDDNQKVGVAKVGNGPVSLYFAGNTASRYSTAEGLVFTGGIGNTQFKYGVNWVAGTVTYIVAALGYYVRA